MKRTAGMLSISEIKKIIATKASAVATPNASISELCFDSRKIYHPKETLFFAIKTELNDGHLFIEELIERGVENFVITTPIEHYTSHPSCNFIQVEDAVVALQEIAIHHRDKFNIPVIGITGSNGKTIVKEWLSQMLSGEYVVVKSPNSYNSQIGVPVSVWQMREQHTIAIFEAGISQGGEMERLEKIIRPTIGILTNIGEAHSRFFNSHLHKLEEKLKLFAQSDVLLYCNDQKEVCDTLARPEYHHLTKISWGFNGDATYSMTERDIQGDVTLLKVNGQPLRIPFIDAASIENALQASVLLLHLGYSIEHVNRKLNELTPLAMRMEIIEAQEQSIIINDTYSLDINSLKIALDFLSSQSKCSKKCLIISDFEQVNSLSKEEYVQLMELLKQNGITRLMAVGSGFYRNQSYFTIAEQFFCHTTEELLAHLHSIAFFQETILIKGARSFHFEKIVDLLQLRTHKTILNISLPAIIDNLNYFRSLIHPQTKVVAMVKALCYGLGDAELINELCYHNIDYLAVAYADEGIHLRKRNIKTPIIVLGAEAHSFETMIHYELEPEIYNLHYLCLLGKVLDKHPEIDTFKIHIKIDTGMHRLGFDPQEIDDLLKLLQDNPKIKVASLFSHLAAAEDPQEDQYTCSQINIFKETTEKMIAQLGYPILRHLLNSSGIVRFPEAQFDMVRLGIGLYGYTPIAESKAHLQSPVTLKTLVTQVKRLKQGESIGYNRSFVAQQEMEVAIIPIGYADGYPRSLSNGKGKVWIKQQLMPTIGKISMDMTIIDVTGLHVAIGEEVIIYGEQIPIEEIAHEAGTIPYELYTSISKRIPKVYTKG